MKVISKYLACTLLVFFSTTTLISFELEGARVTAIHFEGNKRTETRVLAREVEFEVGDMLTQAKFKEGLRRLRNLPIFDTVTARIEERPGGAAVTFTVVEKWTTIPIFKLEGTRGVKKLTTGLYDINSFGRYWELGTEYENLDGEDGILLWLFNPRLFGKKLSLFNGYRISRSNRYYWNLNRKIIGGYTLQRQFLRQDLEWELKPSLFLGGGWSATRDGLSEASLDDQTRADNLRNKIVPRGSREYIDTYLKIRLGQVNREWIYNQGQDLELKIGRRWEKKQRFDEWALTGRMFIPVMGDHRVALRLAMQRSSDTRFERKIVIGGLGKLRGHLFEQFRSGSAKYMNLEFRHRGWKNWITLIQPIVFYDAALLRPENPAFTSNGKASAFYAVGAGLRFMIPRIHRFIGRLDYGRAFGASSGDNITFGFQQFF